MQFMLVYMPEKALEEKKAISNITWFRNSVRQGSEARSEARAELRLCRLSSL